MIFRTELQLPPSEFKIQYDQQILLLGSCFSQNIGERLQKYKFKSISNPFGTIFHPIAIAKLIDYIVQNCKIKDDELINSQSVFVHPNFHSNLGNIDRKEAAKQINHTILTTHQQMKDIKYIFITLGTSIGYRQKNTGHIVANCHKLPADMFQKEDTTIELCLKSLGHALEQILQLNNQVKIILTVSPVRHIKDGIIENSRSKAKLITVSETLETLYENVSYFPAYEWMMDDLRDYRFYEKDLIHPNEQAIDYIWEKFCFHYFDENTVNIIKKVEKINRAVSHRPFNPTSKEHIDFLTKVEEDRMNLMQIYPWMKI